MSYLQEFRAQINNRDFAKFWQLWEEYCTSDTVDTEEFAQILQGVKGSDLAKRFGQYVETALPLWETIKDKEASYEILKLLFDLQTSNSPALADLALKSLKEKYPNDPKFSDRLRLVGLRARDNFQGALANYDLLAHMEKGKFVYHTGGWGVGQIVDLSPVLEQLTVEFEHLPGKKYFTFANSFKNLLPLADDHILAKRFANPDQLEKEAKENPVFVIKSLLKNLGPKTAAEIKEELCDLVIPEKDWTKWWQGARSKLKKDTMVETPKTLREPFALRHAEVTHEERLHKAIGKHSSIDELIQTAYSFVRDNPGMLKKPETRDSIQSKLTAALESQEISKAQDLQIYIFLESQFDTHADKTVKQLIQELSHFEEVIDAIEIIAFKKRVLTLIREHRKDWPEIFLDLLFSNQQSTLRDYIIKELNQGPSQKQLLPKLRHLAHHPMEAPEFLVWYFQKVIDKDSVGLPFSDKEGQGLFFEAILILFAVLDSKPEWRILSKKIYTLLSSKRYAVVRSVIEGTSLEFINEFLLLIAKCHSFTDHDIKILRSLAAVVHPSLNAKMKKEASTIDSHTVWTTEEGYNRTKQRLHHLTTVETVENAREIEAARSLGDLRENSEYKFALEKRSRIQSEIRHLSEQINRARIITRDDISEDEVSVGSIVEVVDSKGNPSTYTILGIWDADADKGILSTQSRLAQSMTGTKVGETFKFRDEDYTIVGLKRFVNK
ncbi:MAG: GreA/GreB family elongation factor [Parachlamydia sp.]|nr:GreA/GreB family elongation factor [Parachlamydia sp.]